MNWLARAAIIGNDRRRVERRRKVVPLPDTTGY